MLIFADLFWEGKPYNICPRQALKRSMQKAQDAGYKGMAGIEPEFIAMKYDEDGKPIKAIDSDPIKGIRPIDSPFGHCAANPGNDKNFELQLDKNISELLN